MSLRRNVLAVCCERTKQIAAVTDVKAVRGDLGQLQVANHNPAAVVEAVHHPRHAPLFDMTHAASANVFTGLTGAAIAFQLALVLGAPWGALTQGGRFNGVLPAGARVFALCSAALLALFIVLVRARAHPNARFRRAVWGVVAYCAVGILANAATPSPAERALWLPVVAVMFLTSLHVARRPDSRSPKTVAPTGAA